MKNSNNKLFPLLLAGIMIATALVGCASNENSDAKLPTVDNSQYLQYTTQIEYYEKLIADLEEKLLTAKTDNYQAEYEYRSAIAELESKVSELTDKIEASADTSTPTAPTDTSEDSLQTSTQPSATLPYLYEISNGSVTITSYTGNDTDVTIPSSIDGLPVIAIGEGAFREAKVRKVTIPQGVTHVDWFAFNSCTSLTEITIPSSVTLIDYGAFDNCPSVIIICEKGSYAELYASGRGLPTISD